MLGGTSRNCAGGPTPWGTWLSCEEFNDGRVWECDPRGERPAVVHPALGVVSHEAVCVDPDDGRLYLTEDTGKSGFYRFTPERYPSLERGLLEIAIVRPDGVVDWKPVPNPLKPPIREQVPGFTVFKRGEGIWFDSGIVYVATTGDDRVYAYNATTGVLDVLYDGQALGSAAPLHEVDNITVAGGSGDVFVCEDRDDLNVCIITPEREVAEFVKAVGLEHESSELTGPAFDPSGTRFYVASQGAFETGAVYEITGPFRRSSRDVIPPELRLEAPERVGLRRLRGHGLTVTVRSPEPAAITVSLTARQRRRGRGRRVVNVPVSRTRGSVAERGAYRPRLRLTRRGRLAVSNRRRTFVATVTVTATDRSGNRRTLSQAIRVVVPRRRRRRRAKSQT